MSKGILKSFFSSGLQAVAVQVLGVLFIGLVAKKLPKEEFGIIQAANAIAMLITTLLSFGMEQVVVRRIAASATSDWAASAFLFHNFIGSLVALLATIVLATIFNNPAEVLYYLPLFFGAQAIIFLVTPLKQFLNAKHIFTPYGIIALSSNICKMVLAAVFIYNNTLDVMTTGYILLSCAFMELIALLIYVRSKTTFKFSFRLSAYGKLIKESMPQYLSAVFDSSLSRLDIILLGFIGASFADTADYGIAYRAYEVARLPIVIIAPIILNIFARALVGNNKIAGDTRDEIEQLYKIEMFGAMLIPITLNILWSPLLNLFFDNKYGSANEVEFMLLSICIPLHFFINLMWTIGFSAKKYKRIATITMLSAIINLVLNVVLIKYFGGVGAASAYLFTTVFQCAMYYILVSKSLLNLPLRTLVEFLLIGIASYIICHFMGGHFILRLVIALVVYTGLCLLTRRISIQEIKNLKSRLAK